MVRTCVVLFMNIMQLYPCWRTEYQGLYFGISMGRALTLYMKNWGASGIFGILGYMNVSTGRTLKLNSPLLKFTMTFGLSCWHFTNLSETWCSASKVFNLIHRIGLVSIEIWRIHYLNGSLVLATSKNLALALFNLAWSSWALSPNLPWTCNTSLLRKRN